MDEQIQQIPFNFNGPAIEAGTEAGTSTEVDYSKRPGAVLNHHGLWICDDDLAF